VRLALAQRLHAHQPALLLLLLLLLLVGQMQ
jgi:hypothetical protein